MQVPKGFWKNKNNHKKYLQWLGKELNYIKLEDWYKIKTKIFKKYYGGSLLNYYNDSIQLLLKENFNQYDWLEWKFDKVPRNFWKNKNNHKRYLQWLVR